VSALCAASADVREIFADICGGTADMSCQRAAVYRNVLQYIVVRVAVCCSVLQCFAVCCSALQCAVQCVAVFGSGLRLCTDMCAASADTYAACFCLFCVLWGGSN